MSGRELWLTIAPDAALKAEWNPLLEPAGDLEAELQARGYRTRRVDGRRASRIRRLPGSGASAGRVQRQAV